jgi:hypothetical protein
MVVVSGPEQKGVWSGRLEGLRHQAEAAGLSAASVVQPLEQAAAPPWAGLLRDSFLRGLSQGRLSPVARHQGRLGK